MSEFPIQVLVIPILAFVVIGVMAVLRKRQMAKADETYAQYRAARLAERLGLRLVEGDPDYNLFIRQASAAGDAKVTDYRAKHIEVRMEGESGGLPAQLAYIYRVEQETHGRTVKRKTWDRCSLSVRTRQPFPPFEVASRKPPIGTIVREQDLPEASTGVAAVDGAYVVATHEPGMAQLLGQVLHGYQTFANAGVHLVGDGQMVTFVMHEAKPPLLANALYYAEDLQARVTELAQRIGG